MIQLHIIFTKPEWSSTLTLQENALRTVGHNMYADTKDWMSRDNNAKTVLEVTSKKPKTQESGLSMSRLSAIASWLEWLHGSYLDSNTYTQSYFSQVSTSSIRQF